MSGGYGNARGGGRIRMSGPSSRKTERSHRGRGGGAGISGDGASAWNAAADSTPKPTFILAKPQRVMDENEEEWPTVGTPTATTDTSPNQSRAASPTKPSTVAQQDKVVAASIRPIRAAVPTSSRTPEIDRRATVSDAGVSSGVNREIKAGLKLISENMEWMDFVQEFLLDNNDYTVIGAIGPQGCGKSTVLSMIGGNNALDMYRQYIFRPASREAVESCRHQTAGIQIYVTKTRIILLDCQALISTAILDDMLRCEKRYNYEYKTVENYTEIESLQLTTFLMQVCHTILVCVDWFVDLNVIRTIRTAEMLRPTVHHTAGESIQYDANRNVNIVFIHQRAKFDEFQPTTVRKRAECLRILFADSQLNIAGSVSLGGAGRKMYVNDAKTEQISYLPLSDMKLRGKTPDGQLSTIPTAVPTLSDGSTGFRNIPDYESLIKDLREMVRSLPRAPFTIGNVPMNEKTWYSYAAKAWDCARKSHIIADYGRSIA